MDWLSLLPFGLSALGGLFGGNSNTSTTSTTLSPQLKGYATDALTKAHDIWKKPYQAYTGERVAGPTASRTALNPVLTQIGQQVMGRMGDNNGYQRRISQLMNQGAGRVSVPDMVGGGPMATYSRSGAAIAPVPVPGV